MTPKQRVLIVDDEPRNQRIVIETLEDIVDYQTAANGEEALALAKSFAPDLILLDIMMPTIDGYEVCRKIRENHEMKLTKIILVSGKAMLEERLKGYEIGADDYITKPFASEELLAKVRVFLHLSSLEKRLSQDVQEKTAQLLHAEAKLMNTAKLSALGEMAGGVAHEINTPLATVALLLGQMHDFANEEPIDRTAILDALQVCDLTVKRISNIINGLRTFSRDGSQDNFDMADVKKIVEDTIALCSEKLKNNGTQLQIEPFPLDVMVKCRPVQISQVLLNLIGNSADAIAALPERWIKIAIESRMDHFEISVTDSGTGISESIRSKIFQPFFTTKDIGKGTGLGLSISKGIAESHGGTLYLDERSKNTRVVLTLPVNLADQKSQRKIA